MASFFKCQPSYKEKEPLKVGKLQTLHEYEAILIRHFFYHNLSIFHYILGMA